MRRVKDLQLVSKRKKDRWSLVGGGYKARNPNPASDQSSGLSAIKTKEATQLWLQIRESQHCLPRLMINMA